jgi:hypothetical protein
MRQSALILVRVHGFRVQRCALSRNDKRKSSPLEVRQAPVGHRLDPFAKILGVTQPILLDRFALGSGVDRIDQAAVYRLSGRPLFGLRL